ncbi:hypothetical protein FBU31_001995 [Coemansia sp. 'formosensis']|nr:hypothetical protein FBU31_001995 [Coemansia sp. 'formosensis']
MARSDSENRNPSDSNRPKKRARHKEADAPKKSKSKHNSKKRASDDEGETPEASTSKRHSEKRTKRKKSCRQQSDTDKENTNPSNTQSAAPRSLSSLSSQPSTSIDASLLVGLSAASIAYPSTPPSQIAGLPPTVQVSPRSRVHGERLHLGDDDWLSLATHNARIVDKSLAIKRIMDKGDKVKLGLAPRRSGKSTFLSMMAAFLSTHSTLSEAQRKELFASYDVYTTEVEFFNEHFAKYPVLFLSFKSDTPKSLTDAAACLKRAVLEAVEPYIGLLIHRLSALKKHDMKDAPEIISQKIALKNLKRVYLNLLKGEHYEHADVTGHIPLVMKALSSCLEMRKPVVLIDEYDKPIIHALCRANIDQDTLTSIHELYTSFYTAIFKGNAYLEFGIMTGVFNIPLKTGSSGLNNVEAYLAHTGAPRPRLDEHDNTCLEYRLDVGTRCNPFEEAFNLTVNDVWGLVNEHIDRHALKAFPDALEAKLADLKRAIMTHCIRSYDGYTYGHQPTVFNTYCVVKFFDDLGERVKVPGDDLSAHYYWSQTASITMIRSLRSDNAEAFRAHVDCLSREYVQRHAYLYGSKSATGVLATKLKELDMDGQFSSVAQYTDAVLPFNSDPSLITLANMCYDETCPSLGDWGLSELSVAAIFRYMYQAGYLTPRHNGAIGIPNEDVFHAFKAEVEKILSKSGMAGCVLDPTFNAIGISTGDFVRFASYVNNSLVTSLRVSEATLREDYYHGWLQALLTPLRYYGYDQRAQGNAEGGFSDLELIPPDADKQARPYVIFEFKRLDGDGNMPLSAAMGESNRRRILKQAEKSCSDAMSQIRNRYRQSRFVHADGSSVLYLVGLTFWRQRFLMYVSRLIPGSNGAGLITWTKEAYKESEATGKSTSSVDISIHNGDLVANSIFIE